MAFEFDGAVAILLDATVRGGRAGNVSLGKGRRTKQRSSRERVKSVAQIPILFVRIFFSPAPFLPVLSLQPSQLPFKMTGRAFCNTPLTRLANTRGEG